MNASGKLRYIFAICLVLSAVLAAQPPAVSDPAAALVTQGGQRLREGQREEALALYRQALEQSPVSFQANHAAGIVLDLMGRYDEARRHFARAIEAAPNPENKSRAIRSMAMSYAFEGNCKDAAGHEGPLYETYLAARDFYMAGEIANELARVCLESGDVGAARRWYQAGYEAGLREPDLKPVRRDLWTFRWEHAQARIAARGGNHAEAQEHVVKAKAVLDKGTNPDQTQFFPYLTGYVAFHAGDYKTALAELQKANQNDSFILLLIAQAHEKLGNTAQAMEHYRKVAAATGHNPPAALSIPLARKKIS